LLLRGEVCLDGQVWFVPLDMQVAKQVVGDGMVGGLTEDGR